MYIMSSKRGPHPSVPVGCQNCVRDLHYAQQGTIVRPHLQDQTEQAWCLTLLTNSVICWTTEYYGMGIGELRGPGRDVPDELLSFIAPGHRENINFFGFNP